MGLDWLSWSFRSIEWQKVLIRRSEEGTASNEAWTWLMERRRPGMVRIGMVRCGLSEAHAEDVADTVIEKLFLYLQSGGINAEPGESFNAYLYRMTVNACCDWYRKYRREVSFDVGAACADQIVAKWDADDDYRLDLLRRALAVLQEAHGHTKRYQIWRGRVLDELSVAAVAEQFGVKPSNVYLACHKMNLLLEEICRQLQHSAQPTPAT